MKKKVLNSKKKKNERNDSFFSKKNIEESIEYIKESRNYIYFGIFIFFLCVVISFVFADNLRFLDKYIEEILLRAEDKEGFELLMFIFMNNLSVATYNIFVGILLGIFPLANAIVNGGVLGYVFEVVYDRVGILEFWRIIPHGIFELPAIFIAIGLGIKNGLFFVSGKEGEFKRRVFSSFKVLIFIILPLLFVAAIIESLLIMFVK